MLNCIPIRISWDGMGWDWHNLLWDGMGWDRKICPMDKPANNSLYKITQVDRRSYRLKEHISLRLSHVGFTNFKFEALPLGEEIFCKN